MALQVATLKTRAITALLFVVVMSGGLFFNAWSYLLLFLFLLTAAWVEFRKLIDRMGQRTTHPYVLLGWILNGWAMAILFAGERYLLGSYLLKDVRVFPFHLAVSLRHWIQLAAGNLYLTLPFTLALHLYGYGPLPDAAELFFAPAVWWIVVVIATMWTNDTMAYLMGSLIGRTPFSKISPKKTWEGTISGIICATGLIGWMLDRCLYDEAFAPIAGYALVFLLALAGTIGDLFESKLKRLAGVKDSSQLMPGHGGVLDRFDSLLFAVPVLYLFLRIGSLSY